MKHETDPKLNPAESTKNANHFSCFTPAYKLKANRPGTQLKIQVHEDYQATPPLNTSATLAGATAPNSPAAGSKAKPANCHYRRRKQRAGRGAEACAYRTSSAGARDAYADLIRSQVSSGSVP